MEAPTNNSAKPLPSRVKRVAWGVFRLFRTALVTGLLLLVLSGLFLNKVGLPEFVKERVIAQARAKGVKVQFSRLRLGWYRGFVAENLHIQSTNELAGPQLFAEEADCPLNPSALRHFKLKMNSLRLTGGRLVWPLTVTNEPRRTFLLNHLNGQLFFEEDGSWELRSLRGDSHGIKLELSGTLANALSLRQWRIPQGAKKTPAAVETLLHQFEMLSSQVKCAGTELRLRFHGDGKDFSTFGANLNLSVPGLDSPWGGGTNLVLFGQLTPASGTNDTSSATFKLVAENTFTPWGHAKSGKLDLQLRPLFRRPSRTGIPPAPSGTGVSSPTLGDNAPPKAGGTAAPRLLAEKQPSALLNFPLPTNSSVAVDLTGVETLWGQARRLSITARSTASATNASMAQTELTARAQPFQSEWGQATNLELTATLWHSLSNWIPALVSTDLHLEAAQSRWGAAQDVRVRVRGSLPSAGELHLLQTNLVWTERLANCPFAANATFSNLHSPKIEIEKVFCALESQSPQLRLDSSATLAGGDCSVHAQLDTSSRELSFLAASSVDPQKISPLLPTNSQRWLTNYFFQSPPKLEAQGRLVLPAWTNRQPDWMGEVLPTISLAGNVASGAGAYRGVSFTSAQSPFSLTNLIWRMPQLKVVRPEGALEAEYVSNPVTRDFYWRVHSQIDVQAAKPFLQKESARQAIDLFQFATPPTIDAEIWGRWREIERLGAVAQVAATNFTFRGEAVQDCQTHLQYTNQLFRFTEVQLQRQPGERASAPEITLDLAGQKIHFTNVFSTLNPYVAARTISKSAIAAIAPYQFESPPTVRLNGTVDLKRKRYEEDLHFDVSGDRFHWRQFRLEHLVGKVDWVGQNLTLTNILGGLQAGHLNGNAHFDFTVPHEADFSFMAGFAGVDLHEIAAPFSGKTNKLEGLLSGEFAITHATAGDSKSWQGSGRLNLQDGLIWDLPMLGFFSPVLNAFVPGLGNSRANEASATFLVTNGVFASKDLEIRATMMNMRFRGSIGLDRRVDLRVEAELLRGLPVVGFFISKFFWPVTKIFEYKVSGTLLDPKAEPLYVLPKMLLMPFHPFKTLKGIFLEDQKPVPMTNDR